ncbi:MAG: hypothetical protein ACW967_00755 [Candidatus Hodarchaeales archaeon]|jgi:hypothetical protein
MKINHLLLIVIFSLPLISIKYIHDSTYLSNRTDSGLIGLDEKLDLNRYYVNKEKFVAVNSTGTFPLPDAIQLRSIVILIFGSIPIGILFLILLYRSRKRRKLK